MCLYHFLSLLSASIILVGDTASCHVLLDVLSRFIISFRAYLCPPLVLWPSLSLSLLCTYFFNFHSFYITSSSHISSSRLEINLTLLIVFLFCFSYTHIIFLPVYFLLLFLFIYSLLRSRYLRCVFFFFLICLSIYFLHHTFASTLSSAAI